MDTTIFIEGINAYFKRVYGVEFTGSVEVTYEWDGDIYRFFCKLRLNNDDKPITISGQFATIEEFLVFTLKEFEKSRFPIVSYFNLIQTDKQIKQ